MLDIKRISDNDIHEPSGLSYVEFYKNCLKARNDDPSLIDQVVELNEKRKQLTFKVESLRAEQKKVGQEIAQLKKEKKDAQPIVEQMAQVSDQIKSLNSDLDTLKDELHQVSLCIPNFFHSDVPEGRSEEDNKVIRSHGEIPKLNFQAKLHEDLGEDLGILDFSRAVKITGSRFAVLRKSGAQLERALIQLMMDIQTRDHGYEEMLPPFVVNSDSLEGTGQFPKFKEDVFHLEETDFHLVPTAEVPLTNFYRDEVLDEASLPQRFCAYTPCFRSEAGSYGKDTRGLIRQHQFNKVELMAFAHPSHSYELHEQLTGHAEEILKRLEIPYRVSLLCSGDLGFAAAKCYDIEVWLPGQSRYREISSCSNFEDFQARRANIRFRSAKGQKPQFVHTLNGSGLAVGRTLIAILENYQTEKGSIKVPEALRPYMGGLKEICPEK